jgi:hypothetical protein
MTLTPRRRGSAYERHLLEDSLTTEQRRALQMLAGSPNGCTEAILLTHRFTVEILGRLVLDEHATATPGTMYAGGRPNKVTWITITDVGRQACLPPTNGGATDLQGLGNLRSPHALSTGGPRRAAA